MRVLHINSYYHVGPFYRGLYDAQSALGDELRVFAPMPFGSKIPFEPGAYTDASPNFGRFDFVWFHLKHRKILRDALTRYGQGQLQYDVIHAHSLFSNGYIARELSKRLGIPYIVAVRDSDVNAFFKYMPHLRALGRAILQDAAKVIFLSKPYRDEALKPYLSEIKLNAVRAKSEIIPNGVDAFWHEHAAEAPHAPASSEIRLVLVGRASKRKNVTTAILAAEQLAREGHKVHFDVVIGLVEDPAILEKIKACSLVTLHQNLTREQLLPVLRSADVFVLPSLQETFGLVYAEAMTQALPVIYTRGQGFDGQFPDGEVGFAVDPLDEKEIAMRLLDTLKDYPRMSAHALKQSTRYDWTKFASQYELIYKEVTGACASSES